MSGITILVLVSTNEFITVKVFLRLFTVGTRFKNFAFFSNPNSGYFLNRFFNLTIDVGNGLSPFDNLSRIHLILFHKGIIVVFKADGCRVFQVDGFINWFHSSISRGFDFFARFIHEFLDNVSFDNRFFHLTIDVGNCLRSFNNLRRVHLVLFDKGVIVVFEVNGSWMFQLDSFINRFYAGIC